MATLLLAAVFLPLIGALVLGGDRGTVRRCALITTLTTLAAAAILISQYPAGDDDFAATPESLRAWIAAPVEIHFDVGLDGLSLWLFGLTALLMVVAVLTGWEAISEQASLYYRLLLILETGLLGVFVARDVILFYVFFEFTLVPLFFLIGVWGGRQRRFAATRFFLFNFAGSVLALLGLLAIVLWDYHHPIGDPTAWKMTFSIPELTQRLIDRPMDAGAQTWVFLALLAGFAVKVPLVPLHTWLPAAIVEAPAAASVLLAGVLLKVGIYALVRFGLGMLPEAATACGPYLLWLSAAGILYGALVALAQSDVKRLIAYYCLSHLGLCALGIFAANRLGLQGGVLHMVNHGLATGGLLALAGMLYERHHTCRIADLGGLARHMPRMAFFMLLMALSCIALPGLGGFVGQLLLLLGMFQRGQWTGPATVWAVQHRVIGVLAVTGVVLGAWYMLRPVHRVFFGEVREPKPRPGRPPVRDLSPREVAAIAPLAILVLWIGLQPQLFLDRMAPTLDDLVQSRVRATVALPHDTEAAKGN